MAVSPVPQRRSSTNPRNVIVEFTRAIVDRVVDRPDRVSIAEITEQVERRFMDDRSFMMSLAVMNVKEITQAAIREAIAETRGPSRRVIVRDFVTTPADMIAQTPAIMEQLSLRWGRFLEWNGVQHVRLVAMTKLDLLEAARIRRERADREIAYALFFERLAERLPDNTTPVGTAIPFERIEEIYSNVQQEMGRLPADPGKGAVTTTTTTAPAAASDDDDTSST